MVFVIIKKFDNLLAINSLILLTKMALQFKWLFLLGTQITNQ